MRHDMTLVEFISEHGTALTRFAYLLCDDHGRAEDLVQDSYLALYRKFGDSLSLAAPVAYARRAIVNAHLTRMRRRSSSETPTDSIPDSVTAAPEAVPDDALWNTVAALPPRQRTVVVCRYFLDLPDDEIAHVIGCRPATVRSLASRALGTLRSRYRPD